MIACKTTVTTKQASRYLQQLCKHFAHKVDVEFNETEALVCVPPIFCKMDADETGLSFHCQCDSAENMEMYKEVIRSHLVRFAHKEDLVFDWSECETRTFEKGLINA